jgi:NAD(P)-dependent dehydrogenase (short-subunit alcohol dehydrogenase family)
VRGGRGEADIPALIGKTGLVTGANSGIGLAATKTFADRRNASKAQAAVDEIRAEATGPVDIDCLPRPGQPQLHQVRARVTDRAVQLWERSEELTGISFEM